MIMFESESALLETIVEHDKLVRLCVSGELLFSEFCDKYNDFYAYYALDGHESDEEERAILEKYEGRIEPHRVIAYDILGKVCSDSDAEKESYKQAGRFGSTEAVNRLKNVQFCA